MHICCMHMMCIHTEPRPELLAAAALAGRATGGAGALRTQLRGEALGWLGWVEFWGVRGILFTLGVHLFSRSSVSYRPLLP